MFPRRPQSIPLFAALWLGLTLAAVADPEVSPAGRRLNEALDSMQVEKHWIAGAIVDWRSGDPTGQTIADPGKHTHCSQFAAAVCDRLGVYLLRPPEHRPVLLANAQFDWLPAAGAAQGWRTVADAAGAQDLANRGLIVVAVCQNPDPKKSGHIAIVRPGTKSPAQLAAEGPDVVQAGQTNYNRTNLKRGFAHHAEAFPDGIRYYAHEIEVAPH